MCKRNIDQVPLACPKLGTWPTTQAYALTGNRTSDPLVRRLALNPLTTPARAYYLFIDEEIEAQKDELVHLTYENVRKVHEL